MADQIYQTCNACGAVNSTGANTWTRVFGVTIGQSSLPIQVMQRTPMGQPKLDFCPDCAGKVTVDKLPGLLIKK